MNDSTTKEPLYRLPKQGKVFGVCAGLAKHFGIQAWKLRTVVVIAAFLTGFWFVFIGYLVAFFILDPEPRSIKDKVKDGAKQASSKLKTRIDEAKASFKPKPVDVENALNETEELLNEVKTSVEKMEAYVTSGRYDLEREFRQI